MFSFSVNFRWPGSDSLHSPAPVPRPLRCFGTCTCGAATWCGVPQQPPSPPHPFRPGHRQWSGDAALHPLHQVPANPRCLQQHEVAADGNEREPRLCLQLITSVLDGCFFVDRVPWWRFLTGLLLWCQCVVVQLSAVVCDLLQRLNQGCFVLIFTVDRDVISCHVVTTCVCDKFHWGLLAQLWLLDVMSQTCFLY